MWKASIVEFDAKSLVARRILDKLQMRENIGVDIWVSVTAFCIPWGKANENITAAYGQWAASVNFTYSLTKRIAGAYGIFMNSIAEDTQMFNALGSRQNGRMLKAQIGRHRPLESIVLHKIHGNQY